MSTTGARSRARLSGPTPMFLEGSADSDHSHDLLAASHPFWSWTSSSACHPLMPLMLDSGRPVFLWRIDSINQQMTALCVGVLVPLGQRAPRPCMTWGAHSPGHYLYDIEGRTSYHHHKGPAGFNGPPLHRYCHCPATSPQSHVLPLTPSPFSPSGPVWHPTPTILQPTGVHKALSLPPPSLEFPPPSLPPALASPLPCLNSMTTGPSVPLPSPSLSCLPGKNLPILPLLPTYMGTPDYS